MAFDLVVPGHEVAFKPHVIVLFVVDVLYASAVAGVELDELLCIEFVSNNALQYLRVFLHLC